MFLTNVATFGENVRRHRQAAQLKGVELAKRVGVTPPVITAWEKNRAGLPEAPTLLKLAKALKVTVDHLLDGVDSDYDELKRQLPPIEFLAHFIRARIDDEQDDYERDEDEPPPLTDVALAAARNHLDLCFHYLKVAQRWLGTKEQHADAITAALRSLARAFETIDPENRLLVNVGDGFVKGLPSARDEFDEFADRLRALRLDAGDISLFNQLIESFERHRPKRLAVKKTA